jgi:DNA-binding ferritin-like protein (Dps family)
MSDFFDKYFNVAKIAESKREYKRQMARVNALPEDYHIVFGEIQKHMWCFAGGDGMDMLQIHYDLIDLFESGAAEGKRALEITGEDVAGFCDELLKNTRTYTEDWRVKLNRSIQKKLGGKSNE